MGPVEEAKKALKSKEFLSDFNAILFGKDWVTSASAGEWTSFCKTQYANDPRIGGWENFKRSHLCVVAILKKFAAVGFEVEVSDEGEYWERENLEDLQKNLAEYDALIAQFAGQMKDNCGDGVITAMDGRPDFEHLEAKGEKMVLAREEKLTQT